MWNYLVDAFTINPLTGVVDLSWPVAIVLILAGFLVGIINTIAGSGTAITYSLFIFMGLPANIANGTIRFGVIMQTLASSTTFKIKGLLDVKKGLKLSIPVAVGTVIGAQIATHINKDAFEMMLGIIMLIMLFFIFYDPKKWLTGQLEKTKAKLTWKQLTIFFAIDEKG